MKDWILGDVVVRLYASSQVSLSNTDGGKLTVIKAASPDRPTPNIMEKARDRENEKLAYIMMQVV